MQYLLLFSFTVAALSLVVSPVNVLGHIGVFMCFVLSALGTAKGIRNISRYVSGASIAAPHVSTKSILGTVVCEANFITGIIMCVMINNTLSENLTAMAHYIYFSSGMFVGICNYFSSVTIGDTCAIISMMDAKDPSLFYKIVVLEIIPASVGLISFIMGIVINSKVPYFDKDN